MRRLLDRRGLPFLAFNVAHTKGDKLVSPAEDSSVLCGAEVRLQQLVLFRLDLPNQKTVCVKAKPHKTAGDVLRPILAKYGFKLDLMHIHTVRKKGGLKLFFFLGTLFSTFYFFFEGLYLKFFFFF